MFLSNPFHDCFNLKTCLMFKGSRESASGISRTSFKSCKFSSLPSVLSSFLFFECQQPILYLYNFINTEHLNIMLLCNVRQLWWKSKFFRVKCPGEWHINCYQMQLCKSLRTALVNTKFKNVPRCKILKLTNRYPFCMQKGILYYSTS